MGNHGEMCGKMRKLGKYGEIVGKYRKLWENMGNTWQYIENGPLKKNGLPIKLVIFHSYGSLPDGKWKYIMLVKQ
jgi:hypothetical protein